MWEWNYAKEPFDMKLLVLRFMRKIWIPVIAALLGAAIIGGGYFLIYDVFGGSVEYEVTSSYYVEYGTDPQTGNEYTYINYASWDNWIRTDYFVDRIWHTAVENGLNAETYGITKQDLPGFLSADLPTDLRMPISIVRTTDPALTAELAAAVEKVFVLFADDQKEIDAIRVVDTTEVSVAFKDIRTLRACILGAVLAAFFTVVIMLICYITDDGIYLPKVFSCRYNIPALGAMSGYGVKLHFTRGTVENVAYRFRECSKVGVTSVEEDTDLSAVAMHLTAMDELAKEGKNLTKYICIPSILQVPEAGEKLREMDKVLLLVRAGVRNEKLIEKALHELAVQEVKVEGVLLTEADESLMNAYELAGYRG